MEDQSFDLLVSCLSLIDIPDIERIYGEFARVLRQVGRPLQRYMQPARKWVSPCGISRTQWRSGLGKIQAIPTRAISVALGLGKILIWGEFFG